MDEEERKEPTIQLQQEAGSLRLSLSLVQIGIAGGVIWSFGGHRLFGSLLQYMLRPESAANVAILVYDILLLASSCLILVGVWRIIHMLKSEVYGLYSVIAVIVLTFFVVLRGLDLFHFIVITSGGGYAPSQWRPIGLIILPPFGIIACFHFQSPQHRLKLVRWLAISVSVIWLLGIAVSYIQWWDNRENIEFSMTWLVMRNHVWQLESRFRCLFLAVYSVPILLWQICLFVYLQIEKRQLRLEDERRREKTGREK